MERETGLEPATLSLGRCFSSKNRLKSFVLERENWTQPPKSWTRGRDLDSIWTFGAFLKPANHGSAVPIMDAIWTHGLGCS